MSSQSQCGMCMSVYVNMHIYFDKERDDITKIKYILGKYFLKS